MLVYLFLLGVFRPDLLLSDTVTTGGDTASHYYTAWYLAKVLLPHGQISGWCPGNYAGFPLLQYYFPLPFLLMAALNLALPLTVSFKMGTVAGIFALPAATYAMLRMIGVQRPAPVLGAALSLLFLFMGGNSMWGGNLASTMAGEFCYGMGFSLSVLWLGVLYRAQEKGSSALGPAALLAAVGLSHAYALLFCGFASAYFLLSRRDFSKNAALLLKTHALAFCFLGFWILPLIYNLPDTTRFSILWIFPTLADAVTQTFPLLMVPAAALGVPCLLARAALFLRKPRQGFRPCGSPAAFVAFLCATGLFLYFLGYRARVVDVRFLPFFQFFLVISPALLPGLPAVRKAGKPLAAVFSALLVLGAILWVEENEPPAVSWVRGNYAGVEKTPLWPAFSQVNEFISGSFKDPRVAYEHSMVHQRAGTVRAFENIPLFSGRATLEGVYIQASLTAPFIFYIQSQISQKPSTPIPDYSYSRFDPEDALPRLGMFCADTVISAERESEAAWDAIPQVTRAFSKGPYTVYTVNGPKPPYARELANRPVLFPEKGFRFNAYRWFRRSDLSVVPVFCDSPDPEDARAFSAPTDPDPAHLAAVPIPGAGASPAVRVEFQRIEIEDAAPGRPLLVSASYHRGWKARGARRIYLAGPGLMMVVPQASRVTLVYGPTIADRLGLGLTLFAILLSLLARFGPTSAWLARADLRLARRAGLITAPIVILACAGLAYFLFVGAPEYPATPYNEAVAQFTAKDYAAARKGFLKVWDDHPQTLVTAEAGYHLAMTYYRQEDWANTLVWLDKTIEEYPETGRAAEIGFHQGLCLERLNRPEEAQAAFRETARRFPESVFGRLAKEKVFAGQG
ncbi:MAG: 6-pyruvoyl-tetrahydropterin synthase-related protein [Thermodesulfobacteriota bacterium]